MSPLDRQEHEALDLLRRLEQRLCADLAREDTERPDGVGLIAAERERQVSEEGWTPEHDDGHTAGELAEAAVIYAMTPAQLVLAQGRLSRPWGNVALSSTRQRDLVKAGALIAAEIDRLSRVRDTERPDDRREQMPNPTDYHGGGVMRVRDTKRWAFDHSRPCDCGHRYDQHDQEYGITCKAKGCECRQLYQSPLWWTPAMQAAARVYGQTLYRSDGYGFRVKEIIEAYEAVRDTEQEHERDDKSGDWRCWDCGSTDMNHKCPRQEHNR